MATEIKEVIEQRISGGGHHHMASGVGLAAGVGGAIGSVVGNWVTDNRRNGYHGESCAPVGSYTTGVQAGEACKYRDLMSSQNALSEQMQALQNSVYYTGTGIKDAVNANGALLANLVQQNGFQTLLQFKDLDKTLCMMNAAQIAQGTANTQYIVNTFNENAKEAAAAKLNETQRKLDLYATGNFPITRNAGIVYSDPCNPCGRDNQVDQITIINQNINALNSTAQQTAATVQQLAGIVASLAAK